MTTNDVSDTRISTERLDELLRLEIGERDRYLEGTFLWLKHDDKANAFAELITKRTLVAERAVRAYLAHSPRIDWRDVASMPQDGHGGPFLVYWPPEEINPQGALYGGWSVAWYEPSDRDGWRFCCQNVWTRRDHISHWAPLTTPALASHTQPPAEWEGLLTEVEAAIPQYRYVGGSDVRALIERLCDALRVASIPAPERSKEETGVKPLDWSMVHGEGLETYSANGILPGSYRVFVDEDSAAGAIFVEWALDPDHFCTTFAKSLGRVHDWEAAKAAAQADYEQRIKSALETPPLHKKGEVEWRHQCASSGFHDHDGCSCSEEELRARFAAPVPVPVTITNRMVNIAWAEFNAKTHATHLDAMRAALAAALSQKPGEQG